MAQSSLFWSTGSTGDGAAEYTQSQWFALWRALLQNDATVEGVLGGETGNLAVSATAGVITVATGAAVVYGIPYFLETSAATLGISTPAVGTTGHRVVLRAGWTAQTVRVVLKSASDGVATPPAVTQSSGTTWEISLATMTITTGGVIATTDTRKYCRFATEIIDNRQGGSATEWASAGATSYALPGTKMQIGSKSVTVSDGNTNGNAAVTFPDAFSGTPLVWGMAPDIGDPDTISAHIATPTTAGVTVAIYRDGTAGEITQSVYWLAIGPV